MKYSIRKDDYVKIIAGKDKGKFGQVLSVSADGRAAVEGAGLLINKKAVKARKANDKSGIVDLPRTYDVSNLMPVCSVCGKPTRVKHAIVDGKKVRMCECGAVLETKKPKEAKKAKATVRKKKAADTEKAAE